MRGIFLMSSLCWVLSEAPQHTSLIITAAILALIENGSFRGLARWLSG